MNPFPVPVRRDASSAEFFDFAARGILLLLRCAACSAVRGPQTRFCPECGAEEHAAVAAAGTGRLVTWCVVHRSPVPGLETPYTAAVVECDEGPWIFVRLLDTDGTSLHVGAQVDLVTASTGVDGESVVAARVTTRQP